MLRRVAGLLAWALLLHLNLEAADRACGSHAGREGRPNAQTDQTQQAHHGHDVGADTGDSESDPTCTIPRVAECCQAATSCGVSFGSELIEECSATPSDDTRIPVDVSGAALTALRAPDPPPPKT